MNTAKITIVSRDEARKIVNNGNTVWVRGNKMSGLHQNGAFNPSQPINRKAGTFEAQVADYRKVLSASIGRTPVFFTLS